MRILILTSLAIAAAVPALAQATWTRQAPIPTGADLQAVSHVSATGIWAAGGQGVLVHTTDGGQSWEQRQLNTTSLSALFFFDAQHGWAAGNGFFHTTDGGQSWTQDNSWGSIYDLFFLDRQRGWACGNGGVTYRTTNGGLSWSFQAVGTITTLSSIWFVDAQLGWTVDIDGGIYRSTNGGQSWALQFHANEYLSTLQFFGAQEGWAIGGDTFLHTTDGGQSWSPASVPAGTWSHGARFSDPLNGISVGEYGNVTRTSDGGQSWTTVAAIGTGPRLWDVESWSTATSVYAGEAGALALTTSGGANWRAIQSGGTGATHGLDAVDALHAWAANDGGEVLYTVNGGSQWERVVVTGFDNYGRVEDVDFLDASRGWAVGRHQFFGGGLGRIVRSSDGGRSWEVQHTVPGAYMEGVEVLDAQTVLALGQVPSGPRFILRTTNGGQSWNDVSPSQTVFMDTDFIDASTGWVVGGRIYKSTNGGQSWVEQFTPSELLYSVSFGDALHGWAVGWGPTLLRTTDGGQTWTPQSVNAPTNVLFAVEALGPDVAWIAGADGFVARTTDGGLSWQPESPPGLGGAPLEALRFLDAERGWVGGPGIWHRDLGAAPVSLAIDAAGNGVFEPNETVVMAPTWRNTSAAAIGMTGAASSFTGPPGPTYAIIDSAADYGTVAPGATASCTDCYAVNVAASSRPATHWDSTILETVTPTGATKNWTLHIGRSFTDVPPSSGFYRFVETILHKNVTGGCTATTYCPTASTTREQMAVFVLVSREPAGYLPPPCGATPMFSDVPASSPFCRWIDELARRGVVGGCAVGQYCPSSPATREQMAVFVLRTLDPAMSPPPCGTPVFADVPASSPFCRWIEELARRGVVTGCGGGNYCPTAAVSREPMAVFLAVTFGLTLYGL